MFYIINFEVIIMSETKWECKVCMDEAKDAVVTRCGHLYCW